jgi:type I restriction enzyme R subunit
MIEFKQIIGRGTRLFDGENYFTIYDFVKAYEHFNDPEWDGEPQAPLFVKDPRGGRNQVNTMSPKQIVAIETKGQKFSAPKPSKSNSLMVKNAPSSTGYLLGSGVQTVNP